MVEEGEIAEGMMVMVQKERHETPQRAKILKVPPYTEVVNDQEIVYDDQALVEYPDTAIDEVFTNLRENVELENITL